MTVVDCGPLSPEEAKIVAFAEGMVNNRGEGVFDAFGAHGFTRDDAGGMNCFLDAVHVMQPHQAEGTTGTGLEPVRDAA